MQHRTFWALAVGFAICGASTSGLIGTHFIPAAHDHGMAQPVAAGLLALVGVFDIVGTILSGWLTDRFDPRILHPPMFLFIVFYGLDWVATVPPTMAICREVFGDRGSIVFGWVFASHQVGASIATVLVGVARDAMGSYTIAWLSAAGLCAVATVVSLSIRRHRLPEVEPAA